MNLNKTYLDDEKIAKKIEKKNRCKKKIERVLKMNSMEIPRVVQNPTPRSRECYWWSTRVNAFALLLNIHLCESVYFPSEQLLIASKARESWRLSEVDFDFYHGYTFYTGLMRRLKHENKTLLFDCLGYC